MKKRILLLAASNLVLMVGSPFGLMRDGLYTRARHRCPSDQLPASFPDDLSEMHARTRKPLPDKQLIVDDAVEKYLRKAGKLSPEAQRELNYTAQARRDRLTARNKAASTPASTVNK